MPPETYITSIILAAVGVVILVAALVLSKLSKKDDVDREGEDLLAKAEKAKGKAKKPGVPAPVVNKAEPIQAASDLPAGMTWQESKDVYKPMPVKSAEFLPTLAMERPPVIQPQQSYIFVRRPIYEQIQTHLKGNVKVEQGGLLFGEAFHDPELNSYLLVVEAALPARGAQELPTALSYTARSWEAFVPLMQGMNQNWTLVGSYHSHPGMGVFLSRTDLDAQAEIFSQDWQIALVIDPLADEAGFYVGRSGDPCSEWYLVTPPTAVINHTNSAGHKEEGAGDKGVGGRV